MVDAQPIEEQTLLGYKHKRYYPIKIGQALKERYRLIAKLGYGAYSTVWVAWDGRSGNSAASSTNQYATIKVCIEQKDVADSPVLNEVNVLQRMKKFADAADHPGLCFTRLASDVFEVTSPQGRHSCIASKPQGHSLRELQTAFPDAKVPRLLVRSLIHRLLFSINWLHAICGLIHTDISPQNVLTELGDDSSLEYIEEQESVDPSVPVTGDNDTPVYPSLTPMLELSGILIVTDFGHVRDVESTNRGWWMSDLHRAPEVLLQLPWSYPVDLWSVGVMALELLEGKRLFDPSDCTNGQYVLPLALVQYIGYLGPPPLPMVQKSPLFPTYFEERGNWISEPAIPKLSLEDFITTIPPGEEKDLFLKFIRSLLTWDPDTRASANGIIPDEWLMRPNLE
ncbi:kinase-like protein [Aspergillus pseudodeflectus]|uniref:non-specific serine/threonine protein kinase n=1 Tax=Aspergillus pseudodeflectus TaxID=176178 RepID=A0ABR4JU55_9EURO